MDKKVVTAFVLCSLRLFRVKTEGQTIYRKPHYKVTNSIKILAYPGLGESGFEQPGPGASLIDFAFRLR